MRSVLYSIMFASLLSVVRCAPLKIGTVHGQDDLHDDAILRPGPNTYTAEHLATIQTATDEAHRQILNMKGMLDNNHPELDDHLRNAFGDNFNKAEIHNTVNKLATGTFDIGRTNAPNTGDQASVLATTMGNQKTSRVLFTSQFHQMTPAAQAGTVLHEASHAIAVTKDYFGKDPNQPDKYKPLSSLQGKGAAADSRTKSGYINQDFDHLKTHASEVMHKNADSFKVFGHTATHGLHTPLPPRFNCKAGAKGCTIL